MPTNNKTSLGLNSWVGTDKPKRSDFVDDNTLLDSLLTAHFNDNAKHLTENDRTLLTQAFASGIYVGNGQAQQDVTLPFEAHLVIVFALNKPAVLYRSSGGYYENNFAVIGSGGAMGGLSLTKAKLSVSEDQAAPAAGGTKTNLNNSGSAYVYIAFR
jgi:hypothetical protein